MRHPLHAERSPYSIVAYTFLLKKLLSYMRSYRREDCDRCGPQISAFSSVTRMWIVNSEIMPGGRRTWMTNQPNGTRHPGQNH